MRIGISAYGMAARDLLDMAVAADLAGFDAVWLGEHLVLPVGYGTDHPTKKERGAQHHVAPIIDLDTELLDPWVELAAIAAATSQLRVATGIYLLALRHPFLTARAACTLQEISANRLVLGIGSGWLVEEFDAFQVPFSERIGRMSETIEILRRAWQGGPFSYSGNHFSFGPIQVTPRAVDVPLILGGNSEPALRRAALLGDGWFSSGTPLPDDALRLRDRLVELRAELGHTDPFRVHVRVDGCDPAVLARYEAEGLDDVVIWADQLWSGGTADEKREGFARAAESIGLRFEQRR